MNIIIANPIILTEDDDKISVQSNVHILEDPDGRMNIFDVTSKAINLRFKPNQQKDFNLGYSHSAFWLNLEVTNINKSQNHFVLVCEYRLIDHFDVYLKKDDQWKKSSGGDQHPRNTWSDRQRTPFFHIEIPSDSTVTIFIRASSEGSVQIPVSIYTLEAFAAENLLQNTLGSLVLGIFIFIILFSLLYGIALRSISQIAYSILLTGLGLFVITLSGIGQMLLWGPANPITNPILVLAGGIALIGACLFFLRYLRMDINQPQLKYAMYGNFLLGVLLIFTAIFLPYHIGAKFLIPCAIYCATVVLLANINGTLKMHRQAIMGTIAWSIACVGFIIVAFQYAGFLPRNFLIENANIIGVLFGITFQSIAIGDRVLFLQRQQIETTKKHNLELEQKIEERTRELKKSRNEVEKLADFSRRINETIDIEVVLDEILEYFESEYNLESVVLSIVDNESNELKPLRARYLNGSNDPRSEFVHNLRVPLTKESGTLFRTYQRQKPVYFRHKFDKYHFPNELDRIIVSELQLEAFGNVPLIVQNQTIGILWVNFGSELPGSEVRRSLERFCQQIAGAVFNTILLNRVTVASKEIEQLSDVTRRVNEDASNTEAVFKSIFAFLEQIYGIDAILFLADEDRRFLIPNQFSESGSKEDLSLLYDLKLPISDEGGAIARTFLNNRMDIYNNSLGEFDTDFDELLSRKFNVLNYAHIPLNVKGEVIGVLSAAGKDRRMQFTEQLARKIERFCTQIAGAVQAASLFDQVRDARERAERIAIELTELNEFSREMNASLDLDEIFDRIFGFLTRGTDIDTIWLQLVDQAQNELYTYWGKHPNEDWIGLRRDQLLSAEELASRSKGFAFFYNLRVPLDRRGGSLAETYRRKVPLYIPDVYNVGKRLITNALDGEEYPITALDYRINSMGEIKSLLQTPLILEDKVIGILNLSRYQHKFILTPGMIDRILAASAQMTGALHNAILMKRIDEERGRAEQARAESDLLLTNILPRETATELKMEGKVQPKSYNSVSVLFTDFVGFTKFSQSLTADRLVQELDGCFSQFDEIVRRQNLEKLKTIGDSYMCAGGLPRSNHTHAVDVCLAALEILSFCMQTTALKASQDEEFWKIRIGIHSGPVTAGVIGNTKFAYDIWGDTVNTASRMESYGVADRINLSTDTYEKVKDFFTCEYRGSINVKGKGEMEMYFLDRIRPELSLDKDGFRPNGTFEKLRAELEAST